MKILVSGTWRREKAEQYRTEAEQVGMLLATRGHILVTGAGTGMSELVVRSYKVHGGSKYTAYLPSEKCRAEVGEELGPQPDEIIETNVDYPTRNVMMVRDIDAIIALNGGLGTLTEVIHGANDYNKRAAVIDRGELGQWIKNISDLERRVFLTSDPAAAVRYVTD